MTTGETPAATTSAAPCAASKARIPKPQETPPAAAKTEPEAAKPAPEPPFNIDGVFTVTRAMPICGRQYDKGATFRFNEAPAGEAVLRKLVAQNLVTSSNG